MDVEAALKQDVTSILGGMAPAPPPSVAEPTHLAMPTGSAPESSADEDVEMDTDAVDDEDAAITYAVDPALWDTYLERMAGMLGDYRAGAASGNGPTEQEERDGLERDAGAGAGRPSVSAAKRRKMDKKRLKRLTTAAAPTLSVVGAPSLSLPPLLYSS